VCAQPSCGCWVVLGCLGHGGNRDVCSQQFLSLSLLSSLFCRTRWVLADREAADEVRQHQQVHASQIFKAQQKQYDPAYMENLDEYMVSGSSSILNLFACCSTSS
jgi:hypothetical protein